MTDLLTVLETLGAAAVTSVWLPMAVWTLVALPAYAALGHRAVGPDVRHAGLGALLAALPLGILVAALEPATYGGAAGPFGGAPVPMAPASGPASPFALRVDASIVVLRAAGLLLMAAALLAAWRLVLLAVQARSLGRLRRRLRAAPAPLREQAARIARELGIRRFVHVALADAPVAPHTFGWRRPIVVLPATLVEEDEQRTMALYHELVHVRRGDYLRQWLEEIVGAVFFVHPLVTRLRQAIVAAREMACDAEVLARTRCDRRQYARLLYRFLSPREPRAAAAPGMAASFRDLENRLNAMKHASASPQRLSGRMAGLLLGASLLALGVFAAACTDLFDVNAVAERALVGTDDGMIEADEMPKLVGGLAALQQEIRYPAIARHAAIEGQVLVRFVVDEQGRVLDPVVEKGIGGGCDEEAVRALKTVRFEPGLRDGQPVKVRMTLPFTFKLPTSGA